MNPQKLIMTVLAAYDSFDSYSDIGAATANLGQATLEKTLKFQSFFKKPNKFRFCWVSRHPDLADSKSPREFVLWTNGREFKSQFFGKIEENQNFPSLVAGAAEISNGSVVQILNLLLPRTPGLKPGLQNLADAKSLPDETIHGVECFQVTGTVRTTDDTQIWIEKSTLLIRRLKEKVVTTQKDCKKFNANMQSEAFWTTALRPDSSISKEELAKFKQHEMRPSISYRTYDYATVAVNEPIDSALFDSV